MVKSTENLRFLYSADLSKLQLTSHLDIQLKLMDVVVIRCRPNRL